MNEDEPHDPDWGDADDMFAAAGRRPGPSDDSDAEGATDDEHNIDEHNTDEHGTDEPAADEQSADEQTTDEASPGEEAPGQAETDTPVTSAQSPYPDGPGPEPARPAEDAEPGTDLAPIPPTPPARPPTFGYHAPPPSTPDGAPGHRAGPYPAGPPVPTQPQFGRRAPQQGPQPNADGYYPADYYLGTDWTRVVLAGLALMVLAIALISGGFFLFDRFDPRDDEEATELPTAT
ncbi:MAG: hypothetical protein ACR2PK_04615, partial [Acidimicrobiales bacterium]